MDKQYVRDYLMSEGGCEGKGAPRIPPEVVSRTREIYLRMMHAFTID